MFARIAVMVAVVERSLLTRLVAPMGAMPGQIAAMKRGDIEGAIMDVGNAFELAELHVHRWTGDLDYSTCVLCHKNSVPSFSFLVQENGEWQYLANRSTQQRFCFELLN